jgi:hypothetical protein
MPEAPPEHVTLFFIALAIGFGLHNLRFGFDAVDHATDKIEERRRIVLEGVFAGSKISESKHVGFTI